MKKIYIAGLLSVILLLTLCMTGCSTLRPIYGDRFHILRSKPQKVSGDDKSILRKKVLAIPLINMAGFKDEKAETLTSAWIDLLKEDRSLLITTLTGFEIPQTVQTGIVTDPSLTKKADEMNMNLLVTLIMEPLNYTVKKGPIWPFNKFKGEYDISMAANAVDVESGIVIFSYRVSQKIKIGKVPEGETTPMPLSEDTLNNVLLEQQERLSSALLNVIAGLAWKGKITQDGGQLRINGGKDIGITAGSLFNVMEKGEKIKSLTGRDYYIDGQKAGEIKVTDVMDEYSICIPVGESVFKAGQTFVLKAEKPALAYP